ncbi:MAG TPA: XkdX family protein [Candidatus Limiplasma sp.]|nr:XkdX family protein [Candidatus Limiplasma sp.]HPR79372.1 XkdX family protein [Candidatus Limiplasma sp.]
MSAKYELVLDYYRRGLWSAERVQNAVGRWITQEEADAILATASE